MQDVVTAAPETSHSRRSEMQPIKRTALAITMVLTSLAGALFAATATAQSGDATIKEIEKYRQALGDGNPAELWEARGEDLWKKKARPEKRVV
jgi:sulfur-oxidizing protein SoxA